VDTIFGPLTDPIDKEKCSETNPVVHVDEFDDGIDSDLRHLFENDVINQNDLLDDMSVVDSHQKESHTIHQEEHSRPHPQRKRTRHVKAPKQTFVDGYLGTTEWVVLLTLYIQAFWIPT
jgi:hypothetical protein